MQDLRARDETDKRDKFDYETEDDSQELEEKQADVEGAGQVTKPRHIKIISAHG